MFSPYQKSEELEEAIAKYKVQKIQKLKFLTLSQDLSNKYENDLMSKTQQLINLEKKIHGLEREIVSMRTKLQKKREELFNLSLEDITKKIEILSLDITKIEEENAVLVTHLSQFSIKAKPQASTLRSPFLQEQIKQLKEQNLRLERQIEDYDADCLSLHLAIKANQERKKITQEEQERLSAPADDLEENIQMMHVLDMKQDDLLQLFYMTKDNAFEALLHWYIGWFAFFNQDFYQAANHLYMGMHYDPEFYQTKKLEYIEAYLKTKGLWFNEARQNYEYYLRLKYGTKPCRLEELIFWANRVIFSETKIQFDEEITLKLELSYEMFSDLMEYSARQNDWRMVDGTYQALSIFSNKAPLYLSHLVAIIKPTCEYVDTLLAQEDQDDFYLYYLPKMMLSQFYQHRIKPIRPEFWENEEKKVAMYRPKRHLTKLEQVMMTLEAEFSGGAILDFAWVSDLVTQTDLPVLLRAWCLLKWAKSLIEKNLVSEAEVILTQALQLFPEFKEAKQVKQNLDSGFGFVFFKKGQEQEVLTVSQLLSFKR